MSGSAEKNWNSQEKEHKDILLLQFLQNQMTWGISYKRIMIERGPRWKFPAFAIIPSLLIAKLTSGWAVVTSFHRKELGKEKG